MEIGQCLGVLLLRHRWIQGLSSVHPRWGSDCQQNLHDEGGGLKYAPQALSGKAAPQDIMLF